jgi:hypothetical protein
MIDKSSGTARQALNPFTYYGETVKCFDCKPAALKLPGSAPVLRVIEGGRNDDVTALRLRLMRNGYLPIPLFGKEPTLPRWTALEAVSRKHIEMYVKQWPDADNTGGLTRPMPTIDIDVMHPEAAGKLEELAREHFEERGRILVRFGQAPRRAIPLRTNAPFKKMARIFVAPDGSTQKIEILGDGQQLVLYGIHPDTRQPYRWHGGEPSEVARHELPSVGGDDMEKFIDEATTLLVEEFGFKLKAEKQRSERKDRVSLTPTGERDPFTQVADQCDSRGPAWAEEALHRNCEELRDTQKGDRNNKLYRCACRMGTMVARDWIARDVVESALEEAAADYIKTEKNGERAAKATIRSGIEDGLECPHDDLPDTAEGKSSEPSKKKEKPAEWHNAELFDPWAQFYVPEFPLDVLPRPVQEFVVAQGEVIGCGPAAMAMAVLATFSSALDHRFALKMMRHGNWYASPRLWMLFFGDASQRKTPLFDTATKPLETFQAEVQEHYRLDLQAAEASNSEKPPLPERYVAYDTTPEKLGELLSRSGRGLLVKHDELAGWIGSMERYGRGGNANRGFWLKAFDGGPFVVDRIGRGSIFVDNLSVSLVGGIQPRKMAQIGDLTSDGLLQRFIPFVMKAPKLALDRPCDTQNYNSLVRQLLLTSSQVLSLSDPALEVMNDLRRHLHDLGLITGGLTEGFQSFVNKLSGMAGSLTLILHMLTNPSGLKPVGKATAEDVQRLVVDFILPHALEFYRCAESTTNGDRLRKIASWILTSGKQRFVVSDLTNNIADLKGLSVLEANERVSPLVATDWIKPEGRGVENRSWRVNPNVHEQFSARMNEEEARKAQLAKLMGSPRRDKA